jgi:hypothetical protein
LCTKIFTTVAKAKELSNQTAGLLHRVRPKSGYLAVICF